MRNPTLAAFLVTVVAIVPTGWHALRADLQTDGKHLRPLQQSFTVGDVRVTLDVDRSVVMTGSTVKATFSSRRLPQPERPRLPSCQC